MRENAVRDSSEKLRKKLADFEVTNDYPEKVSDEEKSDIETRLFNVFKKYVDKK